MGIDRQSVCATRIQTFSFALITIRCLRSEHFIKCILIASHVHKVLLLGMGDDLERLIFGLEALRGVPDVPTSQELQQQQQQQQQEQGRCGAAVHSLNVDHDDDNSASCSEYEIIPGLTRVAHLGHGAFSTVSLCRIGQNWSQLDTSTHLQEGGLVACKVLSKRHLRQVFRVKRAQEGGLEDDTAVSKVTKMMVLQHSSTVINSVNHILILLASSAMCSSIAHYPFHSPFPLMSLAPTCT